MRVTDVTVRRAQRNQHLNQFVLALEGRPLADSTATSTSIIADEGLMRTPIGSILPLTEEGRAEQVALEGEPIAPFHPTKQPHRIARNRYRMTSRLHGCSTELTLLEGHHLRVHDVRSGGRTLKYEFDLRYVHPRPVRVRHIAWVWLGLCIGCLTAAAGAFFVALESGPRALPLGVGCGTLLPGAVALMLFFRRTTESLQFLSQHGMAAFVTVTAGLGAIRNGKPFFVELIKSIHAAQSERTQLRQQLLSAEMREHHRLRDLGVLSEREYSQSKARILARH
ncbi:MAG: hypothetical protein ABW034_06215 [Steroidobacteraceae bacterium]